ncbi:kinase-like domain-containing protein [Hyaloraphidium curvatum]|nr:kinase-like domain-containing protein [Hyaloraphidium curvatum]
MGLFGTKEEKFVEACWLESPGRLRRLLADQTIDVNARSRTFGRTGFIFACVCGKPDVVALLLADRRINVNAKDNNGRTGFIEACANGNSDVVRLLLGDLRVDVNAKSNDHLSALMVACVANQAHVVKLLLGDSRVDVNDSAELARLSSLVTKTQAVLRCATAFVISCWLGHSETVWEMLRSHEVDANLADADGNTGLIFACQQGHDEIVKALLSFSERVDLWARNKVGLAAADFASLRVRQLLGEKLEGPRDQQQRFGAAADGGVPLPDGWAMVVDRSTCRWYFVDNRTSPPTTTWTDPRTGTFAAPYPLSSTMEPRNHPPSEGVDPGTPYAAAAVAAVAHAPDAPENDELFAQAVAMGIEDLDRISAAVRALSADPAQPAITMESVLDWLDRVDRAPAAADSSPGSSPSENRVAHFEDNHDMERELELRLRHLELLEQQEVAGPLVPEQGASESYDHISSSGGSAGTEISSYLSKLRITSSEVFYDELLVLGEGGFGKVYRGVLRGATAVAVKTIKGTVEPKTVRMFLSEISVWEGLTQRNVLPLLAFCESPPMMISELCEQGNMRKRLDELDWDQSVGLRYLRGAADGMAYLHSFRVLHGDLKSLNIMIDHDIPKIADFGLSRVRTHLSISSTANGGGSSGTPAFMAPELWDGERLRAPGDVYSFAMVCYEVTSEGMYPFQGMIAMAIMRKVCDEQKRPSRPDAASDAIWALMQRMWAHRPEDRPTFVEIAAEMARWR